MAQLEHAKDRILMGAERKSAVVAEENRRLTAYHEGGHALVALHTEGARPVHKATIVPRGQSLGMVMQLPEKDELNLTKKQLLAMLDVTMGGRVAEELIFGRDEVTTGASSDLRQATRLAREMVTKYGFSSKLGLASQDYSEHGMSDDTRTAIEEEVKTMLNEANQRATALLKKHDGQLHLLAKALLERETLTGAELRRMVNAPMKAGDVATLGDIERTRREKDEKEGLLSHGLKLNFIDPTVNLDVYKRVFGRRLGVDSSFTSARVRMSTTCTPSATIKTPRRTVAVERTRKASRSFVSQH